MLRRKSPWAAGGLGFFVGPLGYFYLGWRYGVCALVVFIAFMLPLAPFDLDLRATLDCLIADFVRLAAKLDRLVDRQRRQTQPEVQARADDAKDGVDRLRRLVRVLEEALVDRCLLAFG